MTAPLREPEAALRGQCLSAWLDQARGINAVLHKTNLTREPTAMKSCEEVQRFLMDYLDDELPAMESLLFRLHILLCVACRRYMGRYKDSTALAKKILDDPPPPELVNLSMEFLRKRAHGILKQTAQ